MTCDHAHAVVSSFTTHLSELRPNAKAVPPYGFILVTCVLGIYDELQLYYCDLVKPFICTLRPRRHRTGRLVRVAKLAVTTNRVENGAASRVDTAGAVHGVLLGGSLTRLVMCHDDLSLGGGEERLVVQGRGTLEHLNAVLFGLFGVLDVDFEQRFDVVRCEGDGDRHDISENSREAMKLDDLCKHYEGTAPARAEARCIGHHARIELVWYVLVSLSSQALNHLTGGRLQPWKVAD